MPERERTKISSALGIEYENMTDKPLAILLLHAEQEWLDKAVITYGDDAGEVWAEDIVPRLLSGDLQDVDVEDLRFYTPDFLSALFPSSPLSSQSDVILKNLLTSHFCK